MSTTMIKLVKSLLVKGEKEKAKQVAQIMQLDKGLRIIHKMQIDPLVRLHNLAR